LPGGEGEDKVQTQSDVEKVEKLLKKTFQKEVGGENSGGGVGESVCPPTVAFHWKNKKSDCKKM